MKVPTALLLATLIATASAYMRMTVYDPSHPNLHGRLINARHGLFILGARHPTTHCGLIDLRQCPSGNATLINDDMTLLAAAVPGGQEIYVAPDGKVAYTMAHSRSRPPGSQMGGFYTCEVFSDCDMTITFFAWQSVEGLDGLWACPPPPRENVYGHMMLKASTGQYTGGPGCVSIEGIEAWPAGDAFGAWEYL